MTLCEVPDDARVAQQLAEIALGQHEIEMVSAIGLLSYFEFAFETGRLAFHEAPLNILIGGIETEGRNNHIEVPLRGPGLIQKLNNPKDAFSAASSPPKKGQIRYGAIRIRCLGRNCSFLPSIGNSAISPRNIADKFYFKVEIRAKFEKFAA
jgi:hypothetical protein